MFAFSKTTFCDLLERFVGPPVSAPRFLFAPHETGSNNRLKRPREILPNEIRKTKRNHREAATKNRYVTQVNRAAAVPGISTRESQLQPVVAVVKLHPSCVVTASLRGITLRSRYARLNIMGNRECPYFRINNLDLRFLRLLYEEFLSIENMTELKSMFKEID